MTDAEKMREAAALLSCPFCGGKARYQIDHTTEGRNSVWCQNCDFGVFDPDDTGSVVTAWNTRALPIPVDASAPAADCRQAGLVTVDAGLLDEVKAALRAAEDALADSQWSGGSAERRVSAALARLEREVG